MGRVSLAFVRVEKDFTRMLKIAYCGHDYYADCLEHLASSLNVEVVKAFTFGIISSCRRAIRINSH